MRRPLPDYCANCGAAIPRAAAGRCPFCRVEFSLSNSRLLFERYLSASTDGGGNDKSPRNAGRKGCKAP
jgi:hypothetical protein